MALATSGSRLAGFTRRKSAIRSYHTLGAGGEWIGRTVGKLATPGYVRPGVWWQGPQVATPSSADVLASDSIGGYRGPQDPCDFAGGAAIREGESQAAYDARWLECDLQSRWEMEQAETGADWYDEPLEDFARAGLDSLFDSVFDGDDFEGRPRRRAAPAISPTVWWIGGGVVAVGVIGGAIYLAKRKKPRRRNGG